MAANPRLAAMMLEHLKHPDPAVARAAVRLVFATGCDAPVQYGMDALRHADESVQLTVLQEVGTAMRHRTDIGLPDKVMAWLEAGEGKPRARLAALRMLAELGWLPATPGLERLARGPQPDESAEALAALAVVAPTRAAKLMTAWLSDRQPVRRAAAARAVVEVMALEPARAAAALQPLLADGARGADPLQPATTVGEVARRALAWVRVEK
jgi:HEAT repeat protein